MLVAISGVGTVFAVGAAALLLSVALLARISVDGRMTPAVERPGLILQGFRAIAEVPRARLLVALIAAQAFVRGCLNVLIVVAAYQVLDGGASEVGYLTAAIGAGGLLGAFGAVGLGGSRLAAPFGWSLIFWGAPIMLIAPSPYLVTAILLLAIVGAANSVEDVAAFTLVQRVIPDDVLARVFGVVWGLAMGAVALGSVAATGIVQVTGPRLAFLAVGAILPILSVLSYRRLLELDAAVPGRAPARARRGCADVRSALARGERTHRVAARPRGRQPGEVVIRAGDVGDRFYIVEAGALAVETARAADDGRPGRLLRRDRAASGRPADGDRARDDRVALYALQRDAFLAAVTGHSVAHAEAHAVATARLAEG